MEVKLDFRKSIGSQKEFLKEFSSLTLVQMEMKVFLLALK